MGISAGSVPESIELCLATDAFFKVSVAYVFVFVFVFVLALHIVDNTVVASVVTFVSSVVSFGFKFAGFASIVVFDETLEASTTKNESSKASEDSEGDVRGEDAVKTKYGVDAGVTGAVEDAIEDAVDATMDEVGDDEANVGSKEPPEKERLRSDESFCVTVDAVDEEEEQVEEEEMRFFSSAS